VLYECSCGRHHRYDPSAEVDVDADLDDGHDHEDHGDDPDGDAKSDWSLSEDNPAVQAHMAELNRLLGPVPTGPQQPYVMTEEDRAFWKEAEKQMPRLPEWYAYEDERRAGRQRQRQQQGAVDGSQAARRPGSIHDDPERLVSRV
jgi:hypothetical protein